MLENKFKSCVKEYRRGIYVKKKFMACPGVTNKEIDEHMHNFLSNLCNYIKSESEFVG